jgi:hypothetical protein
MGGRLLNIAGHFVTGSRPVCQPMATDRYDSCEDKDYYLIDMHDRFNYTSPYYPDKIFICGNSWRDQKD